MLIRRHDDGLWAIPGGLVDVGESWAQAAERELWEETRIPRRVISSLQRSKNMYFLNHKNQ